MASLPARLRKYVGDRSIKTLLKGGLKAALILMAGAVLSFSSNIMAARVLGAEGFGIYATAIAWMALLTGFGTVGLPQAVLRFIPAYRSLGQHANLAGFLRFVRYVLLGGAVVGGCLMLLASVSGLGTPSAAQAMALAAVLLVVAVSLDVFSASLRAFGQLVWSMLPDHVLRHGVFLVGLFVLWLSFQGAPPPEAAIVAAIVATVIAVAVVGLRLRREPSYRQQTPDYQDMSRWWRLSLVSCVLVILFQTQSQIALIMVGNTLGEVAAGQFAAARRLADIVTFGLLTINRVFVPTISSLHALGDHAALQRSATLTGIWSTLLAMAIALPMLSAPHLTLSLFGPAFQDAATPLRIMLAAQIFNAATGAVTALLTMTAREMVALRTLLVAAVMQFILLLVLVPPFGLTGAATAFAIAIVFYNLAQLLAVWRSLGIACGLFGLFVRRPGAKDQGD
ncbi:MAG: lipopolysaccharide biosynthesis protein [Rhodospirillales bacterium]